MLCCIVKLLEEVHVSHTKRVGENKTVLQFKQFAEVLLTVLTLKKLKIFKNSVFIIKSWLRRSKMLKIDTTAKNFKIFWSLQVRTSVYSYFRKGCSCDP